MPNYLDISTFLFNEMPVWEGDPLVAISKERIILNNKDTYVSKLNFATHHATHIDLPGHFNKNHNLKVEQLDLELLIGKCVVIERPFSVKKIQEALECFQQSESKRILFKTDIITDKNVIPYSYNNEILSLEMANILVEKGVELIGFDSPSPENTSNSEFPIHQLIFSNDILIVENLYLQEVKGGIYDLVCLPLLIKEINDGVPCRAILKKLNQS